MSENSQRKRYFAIQGRAVNWAWSFRDLLKESLSSSARDGSPPPNGLGRKEKYSILWAFNDPDVYENLTTSKGEVRVALVSSKPGGLGQGFTRGVVAIGRVLPQDLKGQIRWEYWPESDEKKPWDYKFFVRVEQVAAGLYETLKRLEGLRPEDFKYPSPLLSEVFSKWGPSIIPLVPGNLTQGSLAEIEESVFDQIMFLARRLGFRSVVPSPTGVWDPKPVEEELLRRNVVIPSDIVKECVSALASGKHLLLWGVPGTGKTTLARAIAEAYGFDIVEKTATAEWSRVDVVGGPVFVGGRVKWRCGALLEAVARDYSRLERGKESGTILLIDEINRANLERAFGEFLTIFSGSDPNEWFIPGSILEEIQEYREDGAIDSCGEYLLKKWEENGGDRLEVPRGFRVIATMNTYDRRYLFTLGYAFLRRFAVVEVQNPEVEELEKILARYSSRVEIVREVMELYNKIREGTRNEFEVGTALLADLVKFAESVYGGNPKEAVDRAFKAIIMPQLEGLPSAHLRAIREVLEDGDYGSSLGAFKRLYPEALEQ
ncbi:AAA family ATPase [Infirmifilum sp. SLHALR2]|nr:MAG: hypothetical protein B7L53_09825 [Thermofilum sp. NZ13]